MAECVELEVPPSNEFLAVVRTVTATLASVASQLPDPRIDDLRLAVTEACANAVDAERRKPDDRQLPIRVKLEVDGDMVAVEVHDEGGGFDPDALTEHPPPNRPERLAFERGLGIPLMRALADDVQFRRDGGGTTVRLVIALRQREAISD